METVKNIAKIIGGIIVLAIVGIIVYAKWDMYAYAPKSESYYYEMSMGEHNSVGVVLRFDDACLYEYDILQVDGEVVAAVKTVADCDYTPYKKLIGDYCFTSNTVLSLRKCDIKGTAVTKDVNKIRDVFICEFDRYAVDTAQLGAGPIAAEDNIHFDFCDSGLYVEGDLLTKEIPEYIQAAIDWVDLQHENETE